MDNETQKGLISIVIPVYNVEKYVEECLCSVINQTYKILEIICVNDCSRDNSISIIEKYAKEDSRIKIINHSENKGLAVARNTGLKASNGEYIYFLDSDDYIKENIIEKLYKKAKLHNSDVTFSKTIAFADDINDECLIARTEEINSYLDFEPFDRFEINIDNLCCCIESISCVAWNKLFRHDFLKNNLLEFINENVVHEDNGFFLKYMSCFPVVSSIGDIGVMYRIRKNSIISKASKKRNKKRKNYKKSVKDAINYIKKQNSNKIAKKIINQIYMTTLYANFFEKSLFNILKITWSKYSKRIMFFGLPIFRQKINKDKILITTFFIYLKIKTAFKDFLPAEQFNILSLSSEFDKLNKNVFIEEQSDNSILNQPELITKNLNALDEFYFLPNKGNLGDVVIASSEVQYFKKQKYKYKILDIKNSKIKTSFNLVYGGGGIWTKLYKKHYKNIINLFKSKQIKNCIILPSSFHECDEVIKIFDNRFIVFCREKQSFEYCKKINKKAKFLLADDMVINSNFDILPKYLEIDSSNLKKEIERIITFEYPFYKKVYKQTKKNLDSIKEKNIGYFLRTDKESKLENNDKNIQTIDLSSFGSYDCTNTRLNNFLTKLFISAINEFETIVTDRLHVAICAAKLNKTVLMLDNSYKKLSSVYNFSLKKFKNVDLISHETVEHNINNIKNNNSTGNKNSIFSFDALPSNFNEFILSYMHNLQKMKLNNDR